MYKCNQDLFVYLMDLSGFWVGGLNHDFTNGEGKNREKKNVNICLFYFDKC